MPTPEKQNNLHCHPPSINQDGIMQILKQLANNRFIINQLPDIDYQSIRDFLIHNLNASTHTKNPSVYYLIGTDGCHLCHQALDVIKQAQAIMPDICIVELDLIQANNDEIIDALGVCIPILCTPKQLLCYPFGFMDVLCDAQNLLD